MLTWLQDQAREARVQIASGNARVVERRYLPAAFGAGLLLGTVVSYLSNLLGVLVILSGGFAIGYAARAYASYRRKQNFLRERQF